MSKSSPVHVSSLERRAVQAAVEAAREVLRSARLRSFGGGASGGGGRPSPRPSSSMPSSPGLMPPPSPVGKQPSAGSGFGVGAGRASASVARGLATPQQRQAPTRVGANDGAGGRSRSSGVNRADAGRGSMGRYGGAMPGVPLNGRPTTGIGGAPTLYRRHSLDAAGSMPSAPESRLRGGAFTGAPGAQRGFAGSRRFAGTVRSAATQSLLDSQGTSM